MAGMSNISNPKCLYCICKTCELQKECTSFDMIYCNKCKGTNMECQNSKLKVTHIKKVVDEAFKPKH